MNLSDLVTQVWLYYIYSTMLPGIHSYYHEASYCFEDPKNPFLPKKSWNRKFQTQKKSAIISVTSNPGCTPRMITIMQKSHFVILSDASY